MLGNTDSLFAEIDKMRNLISPYVVNDPYHSLDYGYSWADFMNSYNIPLGDHVTYGLKPYLQTRLETAAEQLVLTGISPIIKYIDSSRPQPGEEFWVRAMADDEDPSSEIELAYQIDLGSIEYLEMVDDGNHHDRKAGDGIFGAVLPPFQLNQTLSWQVRATDNTGHSSLLPCLPVFITFNPSADALLFINELMADNDTTLADEFGEYDNWAEIYNGDDVPVWLGDKYLSDNLDNPNKWQLPNFTMQPGTFLVIWCDGQPEQGSFHTDYKLNDEGEELGIFDNETTGYFLLDSVSFGPQTIDISYGRQDDGLMPWVFFPTPTPGATNNPSSVPDDKETVSLAWIYPNPALSGKVNFREPFTGRITDLTGQTVWSGQDARFADISNLAGGIYIVSGTDGRQAKMVKR
jgi:hypothetical protein